MAYSRYRFVRAKLATRGLVPRTRLARFTVYLAAVDLVFYLLPKIFSLTSSVPVSVAALKGWVTFFTFLIATLSVFLLARWARERVLWRLRNRLIVTYVF